MKRVSAFLTDYVIKKGIVDDSDRELYEYGFTVMTELGIFAVLCIIIMACTHMYLEGILFFVVFAPLRSYAGGLHLQKFYACLILSSLTFAGIVLACKIDLFPTMLGNAVSTVSLLGIYMLYPVENVNRDVDEEEDRFFRRKLIGFLIFDAVLIGLFNIFCFYRGIVVITLTLLVVFITMILGKCAYFMHRPSSKEG